MSLDDIPSQSFLRPHSIDLSLELERELENDTASPSSRPQSMDPYVLASLVTQLRLNVAELAKERDELSTMLAESQACEESLKSTLHHVSDKCVRLESELSASLDKNKDDGDAISMLRSKLEDSRRALMRLQTENRRTSTNLTFDLSRPVPSGSPSSKRASFTPLTGSLTGTPACHRRISSLSEPGMQSTLTFSEFSNNTSSARSSGPDSHVVSMHGSASRRSSGFFGRPPTLVYDRQPSPDPHELEGLRKELQSAKDQLEEVRHELSECQEAREASEMCANALRTFIADNGIGLNPNNPSASAQTDDKSSSGSSRWAFKLWKNESMSSSPSPPQAKPPVPMTSPRQRTMLSGLFSGLGSTPVSLPAMHPHSHSEMISTCSDSSSLGDTLAEPISPVSEKLLDKDGVRVAESNDMSSDSLASPTVVKEPLTITFEQFAD